MLTDSEQRLQQVMRDRAATVTAGSIGHPELDLSQRAPAGHRSVSRRIRLALAMIVTAVCVAAIVVTVSVLADRGSGDDTETGGSTDLRTAVSGYRWRVVSVDDGSGKLSVPADYGATIEFGADGTAVGNDGLNALSGRYAISGAELTIRDGGTTLAGYGGANPITLALTDVMPHLFLVFAQNPASATLASAVTAHLSIAGRTLVLRFGNRALSLVRTGLVPAPATVGASRTSTAQSSTTAPG